METYFCNTRAAQDHPGARLLPKNHDDLVPCLHQFGIGQHTAAARKVLKSRPDQNQVIAGNSAAPSLADAATLTTPYSVSLSATLTMEQETHAQLRVFLTTPPRRQ